MPLTDLAIRRAKATSKPYRLFDGGGLYIEIPVTGNKRWRYKYRFQGKEKLLSLGIYPAISLAQAREHHLELRQLLAKGIDPSQQRKAHKIAVASQAANQFSVIAQEWLALKSAQWVHSHHQEQAARLTNHVFPWIGTKAIIDIGVADLRPIIQTLGQRQHNDQLHRVMALVSSIFKYAIATERATRNPASDLGAAMPARHKRRFATLTDPRDIAPLLRAIDQYSGTPLTCAALKLAILTFVRPGELRGARWCEFELEHPQTARWVIAPMRRKLRKATKTDPATEPHVVPLSRQALAILRQLHTLTGQREHVFPSVRNPKNCLSENTINAALRQLGYDGNTLVGHGFRHMASTLLNEMGFNVDAIERQLAHQGRGVRAIYNLAQYLPERQQMMQMWADYLDSLRAGADVIPFRRKLA